MSRELRCISCNTVVIILEKGKIRKEAEVLCSKCAVAFKLSRTNVKDNQPNQDFSSIFSDIFNKRN